jgi:hypothetical protein
MKGDGCYVGLPDHCADAIARERAAETGDHPDDVPTLASVRLHDRRHSFAIADGASLLMAGR